MQYDDEPEESTDSITEAAAKKAAAMAGWVSRLKMEVFSFLLFLVGLLATIDPELIVAILPQKYHGYVILATAISVYVLRRYVKGPPEPVIGRGRKSNR